MKKITNMFASFDTFLKTKTLRTSGEKERTCILSSARPECHVVVYRRVKTSAIRSILLLLSLLTTHTTPSMDKAMEYQKNEQFNEAISCYEEIVRNEHNNINALFNLGCCYLALGESAK